MMTQLSEFVVSVDVDLTRAGQERKNADSRRLDHMQGVDLLFGAETTVDFQEKPAYISPLLTIFNRHLQVSGNHNLPGPEGDLPDRHLLCLNSASASF